jgi:hypothetical protein
MNIDREELFNLYMKWVDEVTEECDWKTSFGPEEIVNSIATILENNPDLIIKKPTLRKRVIKWFELNFGWFFINGRKRAVWAEYLRKKYKN